MELTTISLIAAGWFVVSLFAAFVTGGIIRRANGALEETGTASAASGSRVVSYLPRRKPAQRRDTGTPDLQRDATPRRRAG